jgi:TRAP-type C4-dicarboxylate transport system permease small subunit
MELFHSGALLGIGRMRMKHLMAGIKKIDTLLYIIAGLVLVTLVLVTLTDVILRNFGHPITGSMEIIQFGGAIVFGFSVPFATFLKAQVQVDLITEKLKPGTRRIVNIFTRILGILLFLFIAYNFFLYGGDVKRTGEVSSSFKIPYYPVVYALAFSFLFQSLTIVYDLIEVVRGDDAAEKAGEA